MGAGDDGGGCSPHKSLMKVVRAPAGPQDTLGAEQVDRYLELLIESDCQKISSEAFQADARAAFVRIGAGPLGGTELCLALRASLKSLSGMAQALEAEFTDEKAILYVLSAFPPGGRTAISVEEFAGFLRFFVAYRIHCYFETSRLPSRVLGAAGGRPQVVFVLGGPGAGKGTQCSRISPLYGYRHLSAGDLLREERKRPGSEYGELIESHIREGKLVPVDITVKLIKKEMENLGWETGKYLIDGFPRSFDNLQGWDRVIGDSVDLKFVLFFECSAVCMEARLLERGKTSGRADDNIESIKKRFYTFQEESMPVVEHYAAKGLLRKVHAEKTTEEVWKDVQAVFGPSVVFVLGGPGAGKGTVCARIVESFGYRHLSAGDLLREERKRPGSEIGEMIESHIREGKLVPADITVKLLQKAMEEGGWEGGKYLVDGFPRSMDNLEAWNRVLQGRALVKFSMFLECSMGVMEHRLLERGKTSGRSDDNIETIRKRFMTFHTESVPVAEEFKQKGLLRRINSEQKPEAVWRDVQGLFGPSVVFVLGGPGAGKGTQCSRISGMYNYVHLSAGDLLREERKRPGSELGELIEKHIHEGKLVPAEIVVKLLGQAMKTSGWEGGKYLIDGFPRSFDNWNCWTELLGKEVRVQFALFFDCSEATMEERLLERGKTSGRSDDNAESIRKRFKTFVEESVPVLDTFASHGLLRRVDATQHVDEVWGSVQRLFSASVVFVLGCPGAGKRTQCTRIAASYGLHYINAEDIFGRDKPPAAAEEAVQQLKAMMEEQGWETGKFLINGFPRTIEHLECWRKTFGDRANTKMAMLLECSAATLAEREKDAAKSLTTFEAESKAVIESFTKDGALRRIDANQDMEDVWTCVQEVVHNEMSPHIKNQACLLVKPHAHNDATVSFLQSYLAKNGIGVLKKGTVSVSDIVDRNLFNQQYFQHISNSEADPKSLHLSAKAQACFEEAFGKKWSDAVAAGDVLCAPDGATHLGLNNKELSEAWEKADRVKVSPSLYVGKVASSTGNTALVLNAFVPHWRETFVTDAAALMWLIVEFEPGRMTWARFRAEILGNANAAAAAKSSIRAQLLEHWQAVGLKDAPSTMNNCVHASGGPLEGLRERLLWTGRPLTEDPVGRLLLASGIPQATLEAWLENPVVEGWLVGTEVRSGPIFDCTEDCDTTELLSSASHYVKTKVGTFEPWTVRRSKVFTLQKQASVNMDQMLRVPSRDGKPKKMTVLHFNDVYNVEPRKKEPVGGLARFVTRIKELQKESVDRGENEAVILFSGDAFNPSLTSTTTLGRHMVTGLNAIGIHTACYGNHDFDFGVDNLVSMASENNFPWLISNVTDKRTGRPLAEGIVTRMMDFHGRKIGLIGLVESEWLVTLATIQPDDVEYEDFCPCARRLAKQLKEQQGAEIVIALTHMRVPNDELLAHEVAEVDIILGGHDHHYDVKPVGPHGTYVLKSGTDFRDITELQVEFTTDASTGRPFKVVSSRHVEIDSSIAEEPECKVFVDACMDKLGAAMDQVVGETAVDLDCRFASIRTKETNIGNFVADVMCDGLKTDIAIINSGTLRADAIIDKGPLRMRDLVNLLPMLDELCVLQLSGTQIVSMLENSVSQYPRLEGRFLQVSGVTFTFDAAKKGGERVLRDTIKVSGEPLDLSKPYKVCTKDYLRQGKDGFDVFKEAICLADGEQAGILPTLVREHLQVIQSLNGEEHTGPADANLAASKLPTMGLVRVGDGPELTKRYAINPQVEGRVVCLNPVDA